MGDWSGNHDFLVFDKLTKSIFLVGADFIRNHRASITFAPGEEKIVFTEQPSTCVCFNTKSIIVPPNTEIHIDALFAHHLSNQDVIIEPFDHSKQGFIVANSINKVRSDKRSIVRVVNPTDKRIHLRRGQALAHATTLEHTPIEHVPNTDKDHEVPIDHLNINPNLSIAERESVLQVIREYKDAFGWTSNNFGRTDLVEHSIELTTHKPTKIAAYKTQPEKQRIIDEKIAEMLHDGIIEPSRSPFSSPVVLARKKSGEWRFCVDFRALNDITVKDAYPLPRMEETLQSLHGNSHFTTLDLLSGFWQIPLAEQDRHKSAFVTRSGLYQFKVMPFGLTNSPATF